MLLRLGAVRVAHGVNDMIGKNILLTKKGKISLVSAKMHNMMM